MHFYPSFCYLFPIKYKYSPLHLAHKHPQIMGYDP
jgi:hypothetical protein